MSKYYFKFVDYHDDYFTFNVYRKRIIFPDKPVYVSEGKSGVACQEECKKWIEEHENITSKKILA